MLEVPLLLAFIVLIALVFDFTNGAHDTGNVIATIVATRALTPVKAVMLAATLNFAGALAGDQVAQTIGKGIVDTGRLLDSRLLVLAALLGAIFWNVLTWVLGLPSSSSHAMVGGLIGAGVASGGWHAIECRSVFWKVVVPIFASPLCGFVVGYLTLLGLAWIYHRIPVRPTPANRLFRRLQILSSGLMAFSHGMNDAQKTMGIITLALFLFGAIPAVDVPLWVKISCAVVITLGTLCGGWKIVRTMGNKIFRMEPIHGFAIQTASAIVIEAATLCGAPISTTHVISCAVMGAGSVRRISAVRWSMAGRMVMAWLLTLPAAAVVGGLVYRLLEGIAA